MMGTSPPLLYVAPLKAILQRAAFAGGAIKLSSADGKGRILCS